MCVSSAIGDEWSKQWPHRHTWFPDPLPHPAIPPGIGVWPTHPTRQEFDELKREMEELKKLLSAAKQFDESTGQPDCTMEEKIDLIRRVAAYVGVDMKDVLS